jgi:hypothetical protein
MNSILHMSLLNKEDNFLTIKLALTDIEIPLIVDPFGRDMSTLPVWCYSIQ